MNKNRLILALFVGMTLQLTSCSNDDNGGDPGLDAGFLASNIDALGTVDQGTVKLPTSYDLNTTFAPGVYSGQVTRMTQLDQIKAKLRDQPIKIDLGDAMENGSNALFTGDAINASSNIRQKVEDQNDLRVAVDFDDLADRLVQSSVDNANAVAANGTAGVLDDRHFSANGLEYAQMLEKGLYGALCYNQMVDDYLRPTQAGSQNTKGNNQTATGTDYATKGTDRQHRWDEVFGYFGADPATYPNAANTSNGDGIFIANYTFDFSDETEEVYGINLAEKAMDAFIFGRAVLKAGEGFAEANETTNEQAYDAARLDVILYVEAGLAAAANHYLNLSISDVEDADKLHHLSEALAFIYALSFTEEGNITSVEAFDALEELGWPANNSTLTGVYDINLWDVTDAQLQAAKDKLNESFPGFGAIAF